MDAGFELLLPKECLQWFMEMRVFHYRMMKSGDAF